MFVAQLTGVVQTEIVIHGLPLSCINLIGAPLPKFLHGVELQMICRIEMIRTGKFPGETNPCPYFQAFKNIVFTLEIIGDIRIFIFQTCIQCRIVQRIRIICLLVSGISCNLAVLIHRSPVWIQSCIFTEFTVRRITTTIYINRQFIPETESVISV